NAAQENATQEDENSLELIELTDLMYISIYDKLTKEVVKELIELIEDVDEFSWMYVIHIISTPYKLIRLRHRKFLGMFIFSFWWLNLLVKNMPQNFSNPTPPPMYFIKGKSATTYWYFCSQSTILATKPKKYEDSTKHHDIPTMEQFDCYSTIKITISQSNNTAKLVLKHELIHAQPKDVIVSQDIKEFIKENINLLPREIYAQLQLQPRALAVITELYDYLLKLNINIRECGIDATYNMNNFGIELYFFQAEVNGTGFPLAYLFLENNGTCGLGTRTSWHIKRAVMSRLASNKESKNSSFNSLSELGTRFPFDGIEQSAKFCSKEYREAIWKIMEKHFHQHLLIPTCDGQFITGRLIQEAAIQEVYSFCKDKSLISLWCYLWGEWYNNQ
ncbi:20941_t:CDS:2, partial [Gigaspora margarita]